MPAKPSVGPRNMHTRAEAMGGTLDLHSAPGEGTTVRLAVRMEVT
jgi:signal transduction histidine kinase